jgi:hypothetical protein
VSVEPLGLKLEFARIGLSHTSSAWTSSPVFSPSGPIIDGWQKIEGTFTVPAKTFQVALEFLSGNGQKIGDPFYFDDLRIVPEDGSLESYVYDQATLRMSAKLDENNFASFFGYAPNGKLEVLRRETVRGVLAVQEGRTHVRERP